MKPTHLLPFLLALTFAQDDNPHGDDDDGSRGHGKDRICPGQSWQDWCCIGSIAGPGVRPWKSRLSSFREAQSSREESREASHRSRLTSRIGSIAASLTSVIGDDVPTITARTEIFPRAVTTIASGVTCFGSAVSFRAQDFTAQVQSALAEKSTDPAAFATTQSGEASGSLFPTGSLTFTTTESASNATELASTSTATETAAGVSGSSVSSTSSVSTGGGAFITQAPILLLGGAAVMVAYM